tara:strand:- start:3 stop:380 length:378 start_codon:yes stop_codon:yes gene_type:complete
MPKGYQRLCVPTNEYSTDTSSSSDEEDDYYSDEEESCSTPSSSSSSSSVNAGSASGSGAGFKRSAADCRVTGIPGVAVEDGGTGIQPVTSPEVVLKRRRCEGCADYCFKLSHSNFFYFIFYTRAQ